MTGGTIRGEGYGADCVGQPNMAAPTQSVTGKPWSDTEQAQKILEADKAHRSLAADQALLLTMVFPHMDIVFGQLAEGIDKWMTHQGFGNNDKATDIALMHSELSEMLEAVRKEDLANEGEELADVLIRLFHYAGKRKIPLAQMLYSKMLKNYQRPFRHGKKF